MLVCLELNLNGETVFKAPFAIVVAAIQFWKETFKGASLKENCRDLIMLCCSEYLYTAERSWRCRGRIMVLCPSSWLYIYFYECHYYLNQISFTEKDRRSRAKRNQKDQCNGSHCHSYAIYIHTTTFTLIV